ncbi:MAG: hypothetical protein WKG07_22780 [Hymenobacter sp.]
MAQPFSPSVNIVRDAAQPLNYLPTPNAQLVYRQLADNYRTGTHCFNIGAYGTGKSAFLWAFGQTPTGQHAYFTADHDPLTGRPVRFEQFVGSTCRCARRLRGASCRTARPPRLPPISWPVSKLTAAPTPLGCWCW